MLGSLTLIRRFLKYNSRKSSPKTDRESRFYKDSPVTERGAYLLEYAAVFLGLAFFIIGISDIARIYHARGAVRAGVTEGLRCLYPTDAGCNDATRGLGSMPLERFNAYITRASGGNLYELPRVSYSIGAGWFNQPVLEADFLTKALSGVTLSQPLDPYRRYNILFPAVANAAYLLKVRELPVLAAGASTIFREQVLDPIFRDRESGAERRATLVKSAPTFGFNLGQLREGEYTELKTLSFFISQSDLVEQGGAPSSISFDELKRLEGEHSFIAPCYQGRRIDRGADSYSIQWPVDANPANCSHRDNPEVLYSGASFKVPIMIHIAGRGSISGSSSQWQGVDVGVEVQLVQEGTLVDLGGRKFTRTANSGSSQSGNFVVRGAGEVDGSRFDAERTYIEACEKSGYTECSMARYVHLPLIKVGVPFELRFRMRWKRGAGASRTPSADVGWTGGDVRIFTPQFQAVHEKQGCGFSKTPSVCQASVSPMRSSYTTTDLKQSFSFEDANEFKCDLNPPSSDFHSSIPEALDTYRSAMINGLIALSPVSFWSLGGSSDTCKPRVREVPCSERPEEYMKGCEPSFDLPDYAVRNCELSDFRHGRDSLLNPIFKSGTSKRLEERAGCSGEPFPDCAQGELRTKSIVFYGAVSNGCSRALPVNLPTESTGPLFKDKCRDLMGEFVRRYRERYRVPDEISVGAYSSPRGGVISANEPDSCLDFEPIDGEDKGSRRVCAEGVSYTVAEGCCKRFGWDGCVIESAGGDGGDLVDGGVKQLFEGARQRTVTTVQTAYPPARTDMECGDGGADSGIKLSECLQVTAEATDNGRRANMRAAIKVPLRILNIFGNLGDGGSKRGTVVEYSETRTLEGAVVGGVW